MTEAEAYRMLLAIDIGNTLTKFAVFDEDNLVNSFKIYSETTKSEDSYRQEFLSLAEGLKKKPNIDKVIICSVVPVLTHIWVSIAKKTLKVRPKIVGPGLKCGIPIKVDEPGSVGTDLVADAIGSLVEYGPACMICDMGTATKFILLDKDGAFGGVAIAPGFGASMDSLVNKTASLPEVSAIAPKKIVGKNTADSMNSGIVYGAVFEIEGFAQAIEKEVGYPLKRILTGGYAPFVAKHLPEFKMDEALTVKGIKEIAKRN